MENDEQGRNLGLLYADPGVYAVEEFLVDARLAMERGRGVRYVQVLSEWFDREVALGRYESEQSLGTAEIVALYHFDALFAHWNIKNNNIGGVISKVESQIPYLIVNTQIPDLKQQFASYLKNPQNLLDNLQIAREISLIPKIRIP